MSDLIDSFVEVRLKHPDDFLKICETLTRIGVSATTGRRLYQTCHLLHKRGKYYLVHFKEMLALDGNATNYSIDDQRRRNRIANLLEQWNLLSVVEPGKTADQADMAKIKVIPYSEKRNWDLQQKYRIGTK